MSTPQDLHQTLRDFDRDLQNGRLAELSLEEAAHILERVEAFYLDVQFYQDMAALGENDPQIEYLIAAGCRLASDLCEKVMMRIVDILDSRQHSLDFLYQEMRRKLREKHRATQLLQQAQTVRQLTHQAGETRGLGMIL